jgi:hypothetical protein
MNPMRRPSAVSAGSTGTTFTIGRPALAMMKLSPFAACSIRRERWVFASWILKLRMD